MKPTRDLFDLIKSLSSNEKRYFKLFAASIGGKENSAYMRLFSAIDEMEEYDESTLRERFKNEAFVKQLSVAKNYLHHVILKSLVQSNAENSIQTRLAIQVAQAELLLEKGLLDQCSKFIHNVKKELRRVEDFHLLDKLTDLEGRILLKQFAFNKISENTQEQFNEYRKKVRASEIRKVAVELFAYNQQIGNIPTNENREKLKEIIQPLLNNPPDENSGTAAKFYYYTSFNFYYGSLKDANNRLQYAQKVMDLLQANPNFVEMNPRLYYSATSNLCQALLGINDFARVEQLLKEVKEKNTQANLGIKKEIQTEVQAGVLNAEILLYINNKQYSKAAKLEDSAIEILGKDKVKVGNFYFFELNFNLAHAQFLNGNFNRALDYLENILRDTNNNQRKDLQLASRIFQIILHYELNTKKLISNIADSTLRYLKRQKLLSEFDAELIHFLKTPNDNKKQALQSLISKIEADTDRRTSLLIGYIGIEEWLQNQLAKI